MKKVIMVGIDGLGAHYLSAAHAPFLHSLFGEGTYCKNMQSVLPAVSGPNWMSLITGVGPDKHGVVNNSPKPNREHSTVFKELHDAYPDEKNLSLFYSWTPFGRLVEPELHKGKNNVVSCWRDTVVLNRVMKDIKEEQARVTFMHINTLDYSGHTFGYGSKVYNWALRRADDKIKKLVSFLKEEGLYEDTLLIITADHGGKGRVHKHDTPEERTSFYIMRGPGVVKGKEIDNAEITDVAGMVRTFLNPPTSQ